MISHLIFILFLFALGACIGSFLNVVVWRLPRNESLVSPPSHCPKCSHRLAWKDNIPVLGWILLGGKCRYCREPISPRYPIVEAITGLLFAGWYVCFFMLNLGPCVETTRVVAFAPVVERSVLTLERDWPIFSLYLFTLAVLLAASLIDAELFIIPLELSWLMAAAGVVMHAIFDRPNLPGAISASPIAGAMAVGATVGWLISLMLLRAKVIARSFDDGGPLLEHEREALQRQQALPGEQEQPPPREYSRAEIRKEISKEMLFLMPPMALAAVAAGLVMAVPSLAQPWARLMASDWAAGLLGAVFGAMVGAFVVWITRILGSLVFGREAMGLGDVHLMFGVGAVLGAGGATVAFFLAPFAGLAIALYMLLFAKRRELPYGPYLSLGTACVMLFQCPIFAYLRPGLEGLRSLLFQL